MANYPGRYQAQVQLQVYRSCFTGTATGGLDHPCGVRPGVSLYQLKFGINLMVVVSGRLM